MLALIAVQIAMFIRAIMSWFPNLAANAVGDFVYAVTEPFIIPMRNILSRFEWVQNSPLDIAYFVTFLIIAIIYDILA